MIHRWILAVSVAGAALLASGAMGQSQPEAAKADGRAQVEIRQQVNNYLRSIDDVDTKLGATVWSPTPDVTFIEPLGHEHGWDEIASVVYGKVMGQMFTKRTLKALSDVHIQVYGGAAVVEFDWDFVATMRSDGSTMHTTGRESQVYVNLPGQGWRLVHVHYSGPAVKMPGTGV